MTRRNGAITTFAALTLTLCFSATMLAQPSGNIRSIRHYTVKTERTGDLAAAIKEANAIYKKAGREKPILIWRSLTGPTELLRVDYYEKFADLDAESDPKMKPFEAEYAVIVRRILDSFAKSERVIDVVLPDLSLPRAATPPKMLMVWTARIKMDKAREFYELEKNEFLPAMKNAGVHSYTFARTRFGGPNGEVRSAVGLNNWAELDGPSLVRKGMGDKYAAYVAKVEGLLEEYRYDIYRLDQDLSYIPMK
jgi:hypothetical protein